MPRQSEQDDGFPIIRIAKVPPRPPEGRWLIESLWAASGVGVVGGLPKSMKTWLAAELALAVASGKDALGRFPVASQGAVLAFTAEDKPPELRERFEALARARGVPFADLPVFLINVSSLFIDDAEHLQLLRRTIAKLRPRLLVLDPFVRIVSLDENSAQEVSRVLGSLRALQRDFDLAVLLVHHLRKSPSPRLGQQLRGSGDFAAWYDSGLYLVEQGDDFVLHAEHRSAPAPSPLRLRLELGDAPHLVAEELAEPDASTSAPSADPLELGLLHRLRMARRPLTSTELRENLHVRKEKLLKVLGGLQDRHLVSRTKAGWTLSGQSAALQVPASRQQTLPFAALPVRPGGTTP
jgi:hypothetical protein